MLVYNVGISSVPFMLVANINISNGIGKGVILIDDHLLLVIGLTITNDLIWTCREIEHYYTT